MRKLLLIAAAGLAASPPTVAVASADSPSACAHADERPGAGGAARARDAVLCVINAERRARDLPALRADLHLRRAAQGYADRLRDHGMLVDTLGSSTPQRRIAAAGYAGGDPAAFAFGETLGRNTGASGAPALRVRSWLMIPDTRRVLLGRRLRDVGIGVHTTATTTTYVVDLGVRRRTVSPRSPSRSRR
ncbi:CAP domain-containing protein [Baekduia soli]|uniref:CAP domain-containing protein n=1 Tax=Baekduia soli TaxID=496014 RepID=UPI001652A0D3|nr:CAP domain-containing protein [Baekduia soli]